MRGDVVEDAAQCRSGDRPALPGGRTQGDRLGQDRARHEVGRQRPERGTGEGAGDAEQGGHREQDRQADDVRPGRPAEDQRAGQFEQDRGARDHPPVEAVGRPAADRGEQEQGHELDQPDQPELEGGIADAHRLAGDVVDLPADDDDHRHLRDRRGQTRDPVGAEGGNAQRFGEETHALTVLSSLKSPGGRPFRRISGGDGGQGEQRVERGIGMAPSVAQAKACRTGKRTAPPSPARGEGRAA